MAKNWWFKFDWDDWLNDEDLSACSLETQGLWLRCICLMYRSDTAELTGTVEQLRRKLGVLPEELTRCLHDLKTNNAANVRFCNGDVSILSRRRQREVKAKENNRLYVAKHRQKTECKVDVRIQSKSKSKNKEKETIQAASPPNVSEVELSVHAGTILHGVLTELGLKTLSTTDRRAWEQQAALAFRNDFTADQFLECLSLLRKQHWRTSAVKPKHVFENLPNLDKIRDEVKNGSNKNNSYGRKQTDADRLAESAAFYDNYPA